MNFRGCRILSTFTFIVRFIAIDISFIILGVWAQTSAKLRCGVVTKTNQFDFSIRLGYTVIDGNNLPVSPPSVNWKNEHKTLKNCFILQEWFIVLIPFNHYNKPGFLPGAWQHFDPLISRPQLSFEHSKLSIQSRSDVQPPWRIPHRSSGVQQVAL